MSAASPTPPVTAATLPAAIPEAPSPDPTQDVPPPIHVTAADPAIPASSRYPRWPLYVIAIGTILALMKLGQSFLVPVIVAVLIFYALVWSVDALEKLRVPRALGAAVVMLVLIAATTVTLYAVWSQLDRIANAVPRAVSELKGRWGQMKYDRESTLAKLKGGAEAVQSAMTDEPTPATAARSRAAPAPIATPANSGAVERVLWSGTLTALEWLLSLSAIYMLAYFLLIDGDHFRRRWVSFVGKALSTKRVTVHALNAIDHSIRRYLGMLLLTNALLGVMVYVALLLVGVDDAAGWGVVAAVLHMIPYFGPMVVAVGVFVTALHQFGNLQSALYASLATVAASVVIGTFVQTWMSARIVKMNSSVVFVAILLFGAIWGGAGLLLAVPIAVIVKVALGAVPSLNPLGDLLGDGRVEGKPESKAESKPDSVTSQ